MCCNKVFSIFNTFEQLGATCFYGISKYLNNLFSRSSVGLLISRYGASSSAKKCQEEVPPNFLKYILILYNYKSSNLLFFFRLKPNYSPSDKEIIFGIHPVHLALLKQKRTLHTLFLRDDSGLETHHMNKIRKEEIEALAKQIGVSVRKVTSDGMKHLVPNVVHQGVCLSTGLLPLPEWQENGTEETLDITNLPLWLVLDELLDPMNVGAIVRSAHYFGVDKLFIVKGNSCKLSPIVSKASSGALEIIDIYQIDTLQKFIQVQKDLGWEIISTMAYCESSKKLPHSIVNAANIKISKPIILILGNEGKGVSEEIQNLCDRFISIYPPKELHHGIDSLNVSVATGVILHALTSQKQCNIS